MGALRLLPLLAMLLRTGPVMAEQTLPGPPVGAGEITTVSSQTPTGRVDAPFWKRWPLGALQKTHDLWEGSRAQRLTATVSAWGHAGYRLSGGLLTELGDGLEARGTPGVAWMRRGSIFSWPGFIWHKAHNDKEAMGALLGGSALVNWSGALVGAVFPPMALIVTPTVAAAVLAFDASTLLLRQHYLREVKGRGLSREGAIAMFSLARLNKTRCELRGERHRYTARQKARNRLFMRRWRVRRGVFRP